MATNRADSASHSQTTLFGVKLPSPILVAPVGVQGILHKDGELATASAAANVGVSFIMSTASTRSIDAVAKANGDGHRWYQLYWCVSFHLLIAHRPQREKDRPRSNEVTLSVLRRAKAAGFTALVVTVDTFALGWRPHDLDTAYLPFIAGVGVQVGTSDPVFMRRRGDGDGSGGLVPRPDERPEFMLDLDARRARLAEGDEQVRAAFELGTGWLREANSGTFRSWTDLAFLRENWEGPIVLKGIQAVEDAHAAMDFRVDGIVVSNHGTSLACYNLLYPVCELMAPFVLSRFGGQVDVRSMVLLARLALSRRSPRRRGCAALRSKASLRSCLTRASARGVTSSRPSQWVHRASSVSRRFTCGCLES